MTYMVKKRQNISFSALKKGEVDAQKPTSLKFPEIH